MNECPQEALGRRDTGLALAITTDVLLFGGAALTVLGVVIGIAARVPHLGLESDEDTPQLYVPLEIDPRYMDLMVRVADDRNAPAPGSLRFLGERLGFTGDAVHFAASGSDLIQHTGCFEAS